MFVPPVLMPELEMLTLSPTVISLNFGLSTTLTVYLFPSPPSLVILMLLPPLRVSVSPGPMLDEPAVEPPVFPPSPVVPELPDAPSFVASNFHPFAR